MTRRASGNANLKSIRSYVNSTFDRAKELGYIEWNKLEKPIKRIKSTKKNQLKQAWKKKICIYHLNNYRSSLSLFINTGKALYKFDKEENA